MSARSRRARRSARGNSPARASGYGYQSPPSLNEYSRRPVLPLAYTTPLRGGFSTYPRATGRKAMPVLPVGIVENTPFTLSPRPPSLSFSGARGPYLMDHWRGDRIPPPSGSTICSKRSLRRSVLFSKNLTSAGARSKRKHTVESSITCRGAS